MNRGSLSLARPADHPALTPGRLGALLALLAGLVGVLGLAAGSEGWSWAWAEDRALIHRAILADLEDLGIPSETAKRLITAIARGQVFHLAITY